jgi:Low-density lipoprotein receptor domain class A
MQRCKYGQCVSTHFFCDGENDSGDWSDKFNKIGMLVNVTKLKETNSSVSLTSDVDDPNPCPSTSFLLQGARVNPWILAL